MADVLILLGSNMEKATNIPAALQALHDESALEVIQVSAIYESAARGRNGEDSGQECFHNAAVRISTDLRPPELRSVLRNIEARMGRVRTADKYASRPIDLDIALYGKLVVDIEGSRIPDPDIGRFPHVAVPLADIAHDWILPTTGESLGEIAARLVSNETGTVRL